MLKGTAILLLINVVMDGKLWGVLNINIEIYIPKPSNDETQVSSKNAPEPRQLSGMSTIYRSTIVRREVLTSTTGSIELSRTNDTPRLLDGVRNISGLACAVTMKAIA
jgi:hypothetical protein